MKMTDGSRIALVGAALAIALASGAPAGAAEITVLTIEPASGEARPGDRVTVAYAVSNPDGHLLQEVRLTLYEAILGTVDVRTGQEIPTDAQAGDPFGGTIQFTAPPAGDYVLALTVFARDPTTNSAYIAAFTQRPFVILMEDDRRGVLSIHLEVVCPGESIEIALDATVEDPDRLVFFVNGSRPLIRVDAGRVFQVISQPNDRQDVGLPVVAAWARRR